MVKFTLGNELLNYQDRAYMGRLKSSAVFGPSAVASLIRGCSLSVAVNRTILIKMKEWV